MSGKSPKLFRGMQKNSALKNKKDFLQCLLSNKKKKKKLPDMNQAEKYDPYSV